VLTAGPQIFEAIEVRRPARFVIASLLLEVWALEGSEIDTSDGRTVAEIASGWSSAEEFRRSF
jgi:hypothetical protein